MSYYREQRCDRCDRLLRVGGMHLCPPCAELLDRDEHGAWWGNFRGTADWKREQELKGKANG